MSNINNIDLIPHADTEKSCSPQIFPCKEELNTHIHFEVITGLVGSLFRSDKNSHISKAFTLGGAGLAQLKDTAGKQAVWST